jgi:hypothetical protein
MSFNPAILDLISGAGSAPAFAPTNLSGLAMWFKADAINTEDDLDPSGNVHTWRDQSGNGRDVTQGTEASRPAWIEGNSSGNINGLPTVHFNTGTKVLERLDSNVLRNKPGWTLFAYYRHSTTTAVASGPITASIGTGTGSRAQLGYNSATQPRTGWRREDANAFSNVAGATVADGNIILHAGRLDFQSGTQSSMVRINGTQNNGGTPTTMRKARPVSLAVNQGI